MKTKRFVLAALAAASLAVAAAAQESKSPTIGLDEIERGQKGYGYTVFAGLEPQRFELEVLGLTRNQTPELSYIIARLTGQDLERSGVFRGMSGSPVYIDGRMAGAVAYSYLFGFDAIAGITPIGAMHILDGSATGSPPLDPPKGTVPENAAAANKAGWTRHFESPVTWEDLVRRDFDAVMLEEGLAKLLPRPTAGMRSAIQWSAAGFGEASSALLTRAFGDLAPGGLMLAATATAGSASAGTADLEVRPGSSMAAVLVRGDLRVAASGTVTDVAGDDIYAFGHPLFGLGPIEMPMAPAEVITVIASRADSFKIANVGEVIGAFLQDREAGVHGRLGAEAPMIPVDIRLRGLTERDYHMEIIDVPQLTPNMMALSAFASLEAGSFSSGPQGLDLEARFKLADYEDLVVKQNFDSSQAGIESILYLLSFGAFLQLNDLEDVDLAGIEVDYTQVDRPRNATLVGVHAARSTVEPGETVTLYLELQAYRGERYRQAIETTVPASAPEGRLVIFVGDGTSMDGLQLTVEKRAPETFEQALEYMQSFRPRKTLRVLGIAPRPGLAVAGEVLPQLPGSVRSIFAGGPPAGTPLGLAVVHEQDMELDRPIQGYQRVDLEVRRR